MNKRYIKEDLIRDLKKIIELAQSGEISYAAVKALFDKYSWFLTEEGYDEKSDTLVDAKYKGCKYWSEEALNEYNKTKPKIEKNKFRHEHVVPKNLFKDYLLRLIDEGEKVTIEDLKLLISRNLIACVVTEAEDKVKLSRYSKTMPGDEADCCFEEIRDTWARYREAPIKVFEVEWNRSGRWNIGDSRELDFDEYKNETIELLDRKM